MPNYQALTEGIGNERLMEKIALKPYACGRMIHPFIDCMLRLRATAVTAEDIVDIVSETGKGFGNGEGFRKRGRVSETGKGFGNGEGLVDRLWEPLAAKHRPPSGYAAKFSMPFCMAVAFFDGDAGLGPFADEKVTDPRVLDLAGKFRYVVDPANEYPRNYTGHIRVSLREGSVVEVRQAHFRGGIREPLMRDELIAKFKGNIAYGGWSPEYGQSLLDFCLDLRRRDEVSRIMAPEI